MSPMISIIVPIYKVEAYLAKCIDSILAQTFIDFELILVDDGSPDHCGMICDEYANIDPRIKVIHRKNGGISAARNDGLEIATGQYIGFVDSDDWIDPDMYETLLASAREHDADIAECSYYIAKKDIKARYEDHETIIGDKIFALHRLLEISDENVHVYEVVWNKLYKKSLFDTVRFQEDKCFEDSFIMYNLLRQIKKYVFVGKCKYYYMIHENSTMQQHVKYSLRKLDALEFREERFQRIQNEIQDNVLKQKAEYRYFQSLIYHYYNIVTNRELDPNHHYQQMLLNKLMSNYNGFIHNLYMSTQDHIYVRLAKRNTALFKVIYKLWNISYKIKELARL